MASFPFTLIDVTLIAVVLISAILAFGRGFVHEALSIAGWIGAAAAVIFGLPVVRPYVRDVIQPPLLADFAAGASIFILAMIVLSIITRAIASRVHGSKLSAIDRSLGFVFGLVRGAVLICLAFIPVQWLMTPQEQPTWIREARLRPAVEWGRPSCLPSSTVVHPAFPERARTPARRSAKPLKRNESFAT